ncbi:hypothetical protein E4U43_005559 [Claviceps pusilla]|uniref:Uncharacterized protein n=1 Tax=Claviceps pusilla TaxID=123648 RepID=A0A9P7SZZ6_9HYPO|nr:hypothetical protein E4U43_005559 [Claviceps pusilla]
MDKDHTLDQYSGYFGDFTSAKPREHKDFLRIGFVNWILNSKGPCRSIVIVQGAMTGHDLLQRLG